MLMKRILGILYISLISVGLTSCYGFLEAMDEALEDSISENINKPYRIKFVGYLKFTNKSSQSIRVRKTYEAVLPDPNPEAGNYTVMFANSYEMYHSFMESTELRRLKPSDIIKKNKYALFPELPHYYYHFYSYVPDKNAYQPPLTVWAPDDNKKLSIYNKENWDLEVLRDTIYQVDGYNYGEFTFSYTYTLTDEALNEK